MGKYRGAGEMEQKAYDVVNNAGGGGIYQSVVVRRLLEIIAKLSEHVRIVSKSGDRNDPICSPWPRTVGELKMALCAYGNVDLRMLEREMLIGNCKKMTTVQHILVTDFLFHLKEFKDTTPVSMLSKNGRKCGHPKLFIVKKGNNPYHIRIK
jgi:hypothetical protein